MSELSLEQLNNIGLAVHFAATQAPHQIAVAESDGRHPSRFRTISFAELECRSNQIAMTLRQAGIAPGMRISLMIPPGIDFIACFFGLLKAEMTTVLIDPGMGRKNMLNCLRDAEPDGLIGVRRAHVARRLFGRSFPKCRYNFVVGPAAFSGAKSFHEDTQTNKGDSPTPKNDRSSSAAIIFTSGSTGVPKGVLYRHGNFIEQAIQIRDYFRIEPGGVDISGFPLFSLFNIAMVTTTVFPRMDASRPASINPLDFLDAVKQFSANQSFGSPALWNTVANHCHARGIKMSTLHRVMTAGAPVPAHILTRVRMVVSDDATVHTPYGATEALPVACIESREVLGETAAESSIGRGICVGHRFPNIAWKIIQALDEPIGEINDIHELELGQIGELIVKGPVVTDRYVTRVESNRLHKIVDGNSFWHRMGDVGYRDSQDRFWFCGRKSQRVIMSQKTMYTIPCESIINNHPAIYRSALVGIGSAGRQIPIIIAEPWPKYWPRTARQRTALICEIRDLAAKSELTGNIQHFFLMRALPVDSRHNAKILREKLAEWAARRIRT